MSQRRFGVGRRSPIRRLNGYEALLSAQIADGALGAWTMQETSGTTMLDMSGNGRHGTYSSVTLDQAPVLDIAVRSVTFSAGSGTINDAAWMDAGYWTVEVAADASSVAGVGTLVYRGLLVTLVRDGQDVQVSARSNTSGTNYVASTSSAIIDTDEPHLYAARWASGELSAWVDGYKVCSVATSGAAINVGTNLQYGLALSSNIWSGRMSHAAYYGTALSDAQMLYHAQAAGLA